MFHVKENCTRVETGSELVNLETWMSSTPHIVVRNWLNFTSLDHLKTTWVILADSGARLEEGVLDLSSIPQDAEVELPWKAFLPDLVFLAKECVNFDDRCTDIPFAQLVSGIRTTVKETTRWCDAGHEVAHTQITLPVPVNGFPSPSVLSIPKSLSVQSDMVQYSLWVTICCRCSVPVEFTWRFISTVHWLGRSSTWVQEET